MEGMGFHVQTYVFFVSNLRIKYCLACQIGQNGLLLTLS